MIDPIMDLIMYRYLTTFFFIMIFNIYNNLYLVKTNQKLGF